ncbi:MAG: permease [Clostridia bacterium]|nr:permease [Clostridia bacterium]
MSLFGGVLPVTGTTFLIFCLFGVLLVGYALGRITIKGVSLGDAGVFLVALLFGALFYGPLSDQLTVSGAGGSVTFAENALDIVEKLGLVLFVTAVGFMAGPGFFSNMKKNFKSYVLLGVVVILSGGLAAVGCIFLGRGIGFGGTIESAEEFTAMISGLLSGALTSTPGFAAAKATVAAEHVGLVSVGYGIAYIFGVLGVVLFVQLVPRFVRADMAAERQKLTAATAGTEKEKKPGSFRLDGSGIAAFAAAALIGTLVGAIRIPLTAQGVDGTCFSLTSTGGCLLTALLLGHFGRIGRVSIMPEGTTLKLFRELGLVLFLAGAGIPGGAEFVEKFDPMYFVYGAFMTLLPMIVGFLFAKYVLKMSLLNNLGSLTGGMTSTPALGTLISVSGTEQVAAAYAATYPIALISVVLLSQVLILLF